MQICSDLNGASVESCKRSNVPTDCIGIRPYKIVICPKRPIVKWCQKWRTHHRAVLSLNVPIPKKAPLRSYRIRKRVIFTLNASMANRICVIVCPACCSIVSLEHASMPVWCFVSYKKNLTNIFVRSLSPNVSTFWLSSAFVNIIYNFVQDK